MPKSKPKTPTPEQAPEPAPLPMNLDVRIQRIIPQGHIRATASMNINGCFGVRNIKVMDGKNGLYVAMPSYLSQAANEYREHCFPITKEFREQLHGEILGAYHHALIASHESALENMPQPDYVPADLPFSMDDDPKDAELEQTGALDPMTM